VSQQLGALQTHTTDTFLFISHTTKVKIFLFKFRCNIFIGVRIIKEMPGSVASGTHCRLIGVITETECVYSAVGNEPLNTIQPNQVLEGS